MLKYYLLIILSKKHSRRIYKLYIGTFMNEEVWDLVILSVCVSSFREK